MTACWRKWKGIVKRKVRKSNFNQGKKRKVGNPPQCSWHGSGIADKNGGLNKVLERAEPPSGLILSFYASTYEIWYLRHSLSGNDFIVMAFIC